jgi:L-asparaginase
MRPPRRPRIGVFVLGGTIAVAGRDRVDLAWYGDHGRRLGAVEVLAAIPEVADVADVLLLDCHHRDSQTFTLEDWSELSATICECVRNQELDGVVVAQGTNVLDEAAYFLHLTLKTRAPVVMVGAMRPASAISADGPMNLWKGISLAAAREARGNGVLVMLNDTILSARDVHKTNTYRVDAFKARDTGPLGFVEADGSVRFSHRTTIPHTNETPFVVRAGQDLPRVDIVLSYAGADGAAINAAVAAGAMGIVSAGVGAGFVTPQEELALQRAASKGVLICRSTRVDSGRVFRSGRFQEGGQIAGGNLDPWKCRILLCLALTQTLDPDLIQEMFDTF